VFRCCLRGRVGVQSESRITRCSSRPRGSRASRADEPLDMQAAARAEEEFWSESWDEPEEYSR
jgi:hypothetical protein